MPSSKLYIPFLSVLLLTLTACESYSSHQGTVGNYYTIQIEKPLGVENPSYGWDILSFPDESLLTYSDLYIRQEGREMAFKPDVPGDYKFEFIVFNDTGEAVVTNEYHFKISSSAMAEISVDSRLAETEEVEETVTAEEVPTPEPPAEKITPPPPTSTVKNEAKPVKKTAPKVDALASVEGRFTIQIYSESTLREAEVKMDGLRKLGYDAYIQKTHFEKTDELWYRVRVGAFNSRIEAKKASSEINARTGLVSWVDKVRVDQ
ncbi:MAG TPA: SPOR domain-containing protein [Candidatus Marinimicrobia bacterium]|mgnify:FL=1|jgi:hypothetical protein|nr:SPOR domain-containing protein [Candidatus Neomarinimicrobiota bacterium]MDP7121328.1 SPOR domain-containing protein [Candidatus Neomarinimicrobiota bacterium]MDP7483945.1 SPOR domain-containing protein [Candidatus Neomarinimicrobiota bacterium]MDP7527796.1 SPOR domain-containing protein [Candidatus Neomarinimicrobiota bacterium]MDP7715512.1 SPOR domain-containing protein [Candidatus Neomarinimicrobiota bacterium]|tara:strand:- start:401 stop:1186 length:786 start_codon:yes stop_codon:yes gene_type:complete